MGLMNRAFQILDLPVQFLHLQPRFLYAPRHPGKGRAGMIQPHANAVEPLVIPLLFAVVRPAFQDPISLHDPVRHGIGAATIGFGMAEMLKFSA